MDDFALYFIAAFVICLAATPVFARLSLALGIIDHPSRKKFHLTSMPLLGGVSIALTFILALLYFKGLDGLKEYWGVLCAAVLMLLAGLVDDVRDKGISPSTKLALQVVAAGIMIASGVRLQTTEIYWVDVIITIVWVAGISNSLNLLDNIDGLSSGTAAITSCFFALYALLVGKDDVAIMAVIFSGACMGFLFHNFHPASLFLGDAGSMFLGTMLAGFGMLVAKSGDVVHFLTIGVILGLLIFDTGLVTIMRLSHGFSVTHGGKDHTSHRLCNLGLGVQASVTTLFAANFVFGICAIVMLKADRTSAMLIPLILFLISITCWFLLKDTYKYVDETA